MLELVFMQRAFAAGAIIAVLFALLGFFVVLRRMSFLGVGISHAAFGGVALGYLVGVPLLTACGAASLSDPVGLERALDPLIFLGAAVFAVGTGLAIGAVSRRGKLRTDASIGIFFAVGMALGILFIALRKDYAPDLMSYLFGSILSVTALDLWLIAGTALVILILVGLFFKEFLSVSFDAELARASGIPEGVLFYLLLGMVSLAIVAAIKTVGIILASALLVLPASTAMQLSTRYRRVIALAVFFGLFCTVGGLALSYWLDTPSGATIVLLATAVFLVSLAASALRNRLARREA